MPPNAQPTSASSKRAYRDLVDYAQQQGAPAQAYINAGWKETTRRGRRALKYPTPTGERWRFIDGHEPRHDSPSGYQMCWHGLETAIGMGLDYLVQVNGVPGVVAAQYYGIPAFCISGGESVSAKPHMMEQLQQVAAGLKIYVALDCDTTGKLQASKRARQYLDAGFIARAVDLQLGEHGDFADFLKLHGQLAPLMLDSLPEIAPEAPKETRITYTGSADDHRAEWEGDIVLPALERTARMGRGKHFYCINPAHDDAHPSSRVGQGQYGTTYFCTCGTFRLSTVSKWLGLDYRAWLKATYPNERKKSSRHDKRQGRVNAPASEGACTIQADLTLNARYVSDHLDTFPTSGGIVIISGTDTGKSEVPLRALQPDESAMIVTPLVTLTRNASNRFSKRFPFENYENIDSPAQRAMVKRLAICLPSLERFSELSTDEMPAPDVLILDELSKQLEQLGSDIYKNGEAPRTLAVLENLIRRAKRVYVTDAYMGQIEIDWLKSIRPDVFVVVNTYRRQYGRMVMYGDYASILGETEKAIAAHKGTVAVQSNSKAEIERLTAHFGQIYGKEAVMSIHSGNSTNIAQKAFLATITANSTPDECAAAAAELAKYRVVLGSPSILTGIDVQSTAYRTFGIFYNRHGDEIDAPGCLQMLARYRNPDETHVWVQQSERTLKVSADAIYDEYREKARGTAILCALSDEGADFDGMNKRLLRLQAELLARRNRSLNVLYQHFQELASENYTIEYASGDIAHGDTNAVIEASQAVKAQLKETILDPTLEAITPEMHQDRSRRGIRTDRDNAAVQKWLIERTYRQSITEQLYDLYRDGQGRLELLTYIDVLLKSEDELKERDIREVAEGTPYMQRKHRAKRARTIKSVLLAVWGHRENFVSDYTLTAEGIEAALSGLTDDLHHDLTLYCGHRRDYSENPVNIVKHVCRLMGLKLRKDRTPTVEGATATYRLEAESEELMAMLARTRLDAIAAEEQEQAEAGRAAYPQGGAVTKIRSRYTYTPDFCKVTPCHSDYSPRPTPPGEGWQLTAVPAINAPEKAFIPSGTGASKINPFSKAVAA